MIAPAARRIFRREAPSNLLFRRCGFVHRFGVCRDDKSGRGDAVPGPHIRNLCVSAPLRESLLLSSRLRGFAPSRAQSFSSPRLRVSACKKQRLPRTPGISFFAARTHRGGGGRSGMVVKTGDIFFRRPRARIRPRGQVASESGDYFFSRAVRPSGTGVCDSSVTVP